MPRGKPQDQQQRQTGDPNVLRHVIAVQLEAVMGELQESRDMVLVGDYERDREACEQAIQKALAELNEAGENADPKSNAFDLAWCWWRLNEAYKQLAYVESRARLARRRSELEQAKVRREKVLEGQNGV